MLTEYYFLFFRKEVSNFFVTVLSLAVQMLGGGGEGAAGLSSVKKD